MTGSMEEKAHVTSRMCMLLTYCRIGRYRIRDNRTMRKKGYNRPFVHHGAHRCQEKNLKFQDNGSRSRKSTCSFGIG
jgi:hypothetical protein